MSENDENDENELGQLPAKLCITEQVQRRGKEGKDDSHSLLSHEFRDKQELKAMMESGVGFVKSNLIIKLFREGKTILRKQDIEAAYPDAFLQWGQVLETSGFFGSPPPIGVLSYPWLTPDHPDPEGFHLSIVGDFLTTNSAPNYLFWDYMCLPQRPRSEADQMQFSAALKWMARL